MTASEPKPPPTTAQKLAGCGCLTAVALLVAVGFASCVSPTEPPVRPLQPALAAPTTTTAQAPTTTAAPARRPAAATTKPRAAPRTATAKPRPAPGGAAFYTNCAAVRAAGKAPIRRGDPGYSRDLDADGDGVGCSGD